MPELNIAERAPTSQKQATLEARIAQLHSKPHRKTVRTVYLWPILYRQGWDSEWLRKQLEKKRLYHNPYNMVKICDGVIPLNLKHRTAIAEILGVNSINELSLQRYPKRWKLANIHHLITNPYLISRFLPGAPYEFRCWFYEHLRKIERSAMKRGYLKTPRKNRPVPRPLPMD